MCQTDLKGELVLLFICKREALTHHVPQVVLNKLHSQTESLLNFIFRCSIIVVATIRQQRWINLQHAKHSTMNNILHLSIYSLINCNLGGDFRPEASVFDRCNLLLRIPIYMHVQHHAAERGPQVIGQVFIRHASQDQVHIQLARDLVDCQVLAVQTHPGKQVQLVPIAANVSLLCLFYLHR